MAAWKTTVGPFAMPAASSSAARTVAAGLTSDTCRRLLARDIRTVAREHGPRTPIGIIVLKQAYAEARVRLCRQVNIRHRHNQAAVAAYCAMDADEFERINARQSWANWRTIPRNLDGRIPQRPVAIVDLCCGTGQSTEVLAYYAAPGSGVLGLEYNPAFVDRARSRRYLAYTGDTAEVSFNAQSVLETFRHGDGSPVAPRSIDIVNASGAVGCHFDLAATQVLAAEVVRVLRPGGLAMIDSGKAGTPANELCGIFQEHGCEVLGQAKSHFMDRYTQICLRMRG
jgi:SAM-dependent methyltransferase